MNINKTTLTLLIISFITGCATSIERAILPIKDYPTPQPYKRSFANFLGNDIGSLTEYIPANEEYTNWSSMITLQYMQRVNLSPQLALAKLTDAAREQCGDRFNYRVIKNTPNSIVFEWSISNCKQNDFMKYIQRGLSIDDCNLNYFTGLTWEGSKIMQSACNNIADQKEVVRLIKGNEGLHRIAYTTKKNETNKDPYKYWVQLLTHTTIKKGDNVIK